MPSPAVAEIVLLSGRTATGQAQQPCGGRIISSLPKAHDLHPIWQAPEMAGLAEALEIGGDLLVGDGVIRMILSDAALEAVEEVFRVCLDNELNVA